MKRSKSVVQLMLPLVEPQARRTGIGSKLVDECIMFGRQDGYREMMLWTKDVLRDHRPLYERAGLWLESQQKEESQRKDKLGDRCGR